MNNLALVFTGAFLVTPFVEKGDIDIILKSYTYIWILLAILLHAGAHFLLGLIELED